MVLKSVRVLCLCALALGVAPAVAAAENEPAVLDILPAEDTDLQDFLWRKRPIVVFADTDADPRFIDQVQLLEARPEELMARDVVVITDTNPAEMSAVRKKLRPRGFMLVIIGKDGGVKLRKPFPWDVREISRSIDKMPLRQEEIRSGLADE